jgi:GntR family transcriptional regulator, rspAB operon transcriptional repressor
MVGLPAIVEVSAKPASASSTARPPKLVRVDLNEQAYLWVRERLLAREFGPGEKLSLQALADELGVSRSPVHQALTRLVAEGLVIASRSRGYAVRPITPRLMRESYDARLALELYAVEESSGRIPPDRLDALRSALARTIAPVVDGELVDKLAYLRANQVFHELIVDLPRNSVVSALYRRLNVHRLMERAYLSIDVSAAGNSSAEHTEIVESLAAGDTERSRAAVRANAETGKRLATEAIQHAGGVV